MAKYPGKYDTPLSFRFTRQEKRKLKALAAHAGLSMSAMLRRFINERAEEVLERSAAHEEEA